MRAAARLILTLTCLLLTTALACGAPNGRETEPFPLQEQPGGGKAASNLDVGAVMRQVHFAFRPTVDGFASEHETHAVSVVDGAATFTAGYAELSSPHAVLKLALSSLVRGATSNSITVSETKVATDGSLEVRRSATTERFTNREGGVEQSWKFDRAPTGSGDLVFELQTAASAYMGTSDDGLHFSNGHMGVRYGHATWIDARGERTVVGARWAQGRIVMSVPAGVVESSAYPAVLDPVISSEINMGTPLVAPARGYQESPSVASNGTISLVVWRDSRFTTGQIYGARVDAAGVVLDPWGILIDKGGYTRYPRAASNGTNFAVVWENQMVVYGSMVSTAGVASSIIGPIIPCGCDATMGDPRPSVISDGTDYLIVAGQSPWLASSRIAGQRFTSSGTLVGSPFPIGSFSERVATSFDGTNYFVVWSKAVGGDTDIYGQFVSPVGALVGLSFRINQQTVGTQLMPAVAYDKSNGAHMVLWADGRSGNSDIYGNRVTKTGAVLSATDIVVAAPTAGGEQVFPAIAHDPKDCSTLTSTACFVVVWEDQRVGLSGVYESVLLGDGTAVTPEGTRLSVTSAAEPSAAFDGTRTLAVWTDRGGLDTDIYGTRIDSTGSPKETGGFLIAGAGNDQVNPAVSFDGTYYLVVWLDHRNRLTNAVFATRVTPAGIVLDPMGIAISASPKTVGSVQVASATGTSLVTWIDARTGSSQVYGQRVGSDGKLIGSEIAVTTRAAGTTDVDFDGANFLVCLGGYCARVSPAGVVLDPTGIKVSNSPTINVAGVAFDGTRHLVVLVDAPSYTLSGNFVTPAGVANPASVFSIAAASSSHVSVDYGGSNYLVLYEADGDIGGLFVAPSGTLGTSIILGGAGSQEDPGLAWDGTNFLAAWSDRPSSGATRMLASRVSPTGTVLDPGGLVLSADTGGLNLARTTDVASNRKGTTLVAYHRFDSVTGGMRLFGRMITSAASGTACTTAAECSSGFCVDGVCCNTACGGGSKTDCMACSASASSSGADGTCAPVTAGSISCRPAAGPCDLPEKCAGTILCPSDASKADGVSCDDGFACNGLAECAAGACVATPVDCDDKDACTADTCAEPAGTCRHALIPGCGDGGIDATADIGTSETATDVGSDASTDSLLSDTTSDTTSAIDTSSDSVTSETSLDSAESDSSPPDSPADSIVDSGPSDSASSDAAIPDTLETPDTEEPSADTGEVFDSGDAADSMTEDASSTEPAEPDSAGGCGCRVTPREVPTSSLLPLLVVAAVIQRRRSRLRRCVARTEM